MASSKVLVLVLMTAFAIPAMEAALHWNPSSFLDISNGYKQWARPVENVDVGQAAVDLSNIDPADLEPLRLGDEAMVNNKIKVSPIGMFSYLLRMAEESKTRMNRRSN